MLKVTLRNYGGQVCKRLFGCNELIVIRNGGLVLIGKRIVCSTGGLDRVLVENRYISSLRQCGDKLIDFVGCKRLKRIAKLECKLSGIELARSAAHSNLTSAADF